MKRVIILFSAFTQLLFMLPLSAQESVQDSIIPADSVQIAPVQAVKPSKKVTKSSTVVAKAQGGAIGYAFNGASEIFDAETQYVGTDS